MGKDLKTQRSDNNPMSSLLNNEGRTAKKDTRRLVKVWAKVKARGIPKDQVKKMVKDALRELYTEFMAHNYPIHFYDRLDVAPSVARCVTYRNAGLRVCFIKGFASHVDCFTSTKCVEAWYRIIAIESVTPQPLYEALKAFINSGKRVCRGVFTMPIELGREEAIAIARAIAGRIDLGTEHDVVTVDLDSVKVRHGDHVYGTISVEYDVNWYDIEYRGLKLRLYRVDGGFCSEDNEYLAECTWGNNFEAYCLQPLGQ